VKPLSIQQVREEVDLKSLILDKLREKVKFEMAKDVDTSQLYSQVINECVSKYRDNLKKIETCVIDELSKRLNKFLNVALSKCGKYGKSGDKEKFKSCILSNIDESDEVTVSILKLCDQVTQTPSQLATCISGGFKAGALGIQRVVKELVKELKTQS